MAGKEELAVNGGPKAIPLPLKGRFHFGKEEKEAAVRLFDRCIETGDAISYNGPETTIIMVKLSGRSHLRTRRNIF